MGTRPEAIKLAPVVVAARALSGLDVTLVDSGQHPTAGKQALESLGLAADITLDSHRPGAPLGQQVAALLHTCGGILTETQPDVVLVQGDTSTTFAATMAAFYAGIEVAHIEAGLHTPTLHSPFPEEAHRRLVRTVAHLHLAPTHGAAQHLRAQGVHAHQILVTGNTVVDAVLHALAQPVDQLHVAPGRRLVVVTAHRRESWGAPLERVMSAVASLAAQLPEVDWCVVQHPNPALGEVVQRILGAVPTVRLLPPQPYVEFIHLMRQSSLVLTDSGGLQEELPTLGVPVLVTRDSTERTEGLQAGAAEQVGTDTATIEAAVLRTLSAPRSAPLPNPYGDGQAARRVCEALLWSAGVGERPAEFTPG